MARLLDVNFEVTQVLPQNSGLLLMGNALCGIQLGWEDWQILAPSFLFLWVWERCLPSTVGSLRWC